MSNIKTKTTIKDIKVLDKTADVSHRAKNAFIRTKEQAEQTQLAGHDNYIEYAEDKIKEGSKTVAHETGHVVEHQGKKAVQKIKERSRMDTEAASSDASGEHTSERASKTKAGSGRKAAPPESKAAGNQQTSHPKTEQAARQKVGPSNVKGIERHSPSSQNELAKRRFVQGRTKQTARSGGEAIKKTGKGTIKTAQKTVKTAGHTAKTTIKTSRTAVKIAAKTAQATAKATQRAVQAARVAAKATAVAVKTAAKAISITIKAIIAALKGLIALISAGGWVVIVVILVICLVGILISSPFGILFNGGADDTPTVTEVIQTIDNELNEKISDIQNNTDADEVKLSYEGSEDGSRINNWTDILAVFAVKTNMDSENPLDVMVMDEQRIAKLREVFWDMTDITTSIEEIPIDDQNASSPKPASASPSPTEEPDEPKTKTILTISVSCKSADEMKQAYAFNAEQIKMLDELMQPEFQELLAQLTGSNAFITLTPEQIQEILASLPEDLDIQREAVVMKAYSLLGKVHYFWGGKSTTIGWDSRWGTPTKVTSGNSPTTGTIRPFGLDCSGYVTWVFVNACNSKDIASVIGSGSSKQWSKSQAVNWDAALPGDLAFLAVPGTKRVNHVGIVVGHDEDGDLIVAHCSSSRNNVVVTKAVKSGFKYIRRPVLYQANNITP